VNEGINHYTDRQITNYKFYMSWSEHINIVIYYYRYLWQKSKVCLSV